MALGGWLSVWLAVDGGEVRVPDLRGVPGEEAERLLGQLGIRAIISGDRIPGPNLEPDTVAKQDPGPGTPLKRMRAVRLMLAEGSVSRQFEAMTGDYATRARIALEQRGIEVEYEASVHSDEMERELIIAQEPSRLELAPGQTAPVRLLRSLGPRAEAYVMVDLFGRSESEVLGFIERHGFRIGRVRQRRYPTVPSGTVVNHSPAPGFRVLAGAEIDLEVSR